MLDQLKSLAVFATVAEEKSFRGAADKLSLSPSVVSYHISKLETELSVALILRSTRSLSLTEDGERLFRSANAMLKNASKGLGDFSASADRPMTKFRILLPELLSYHPVFQKIICFANEHGGVHLNLIASDRTVDLLKNRSDIALRMGELKDSEFRVRKIGEDQRICVVSPEYLKDRPMPRTPEDLESWDFIRFSPVAKEFKFRKDGDLRRILGKHSITTDSALVGKNLAIGGMGVIGMPACFVKEELASQSLVHLIPEWEGETLGLYAVWTENAALNPVHKKFLDYMS